MKKIVSLLIIFLHFFRPIVPHPVWVQYNSDVTISSFADGVFERYYYICFLEETISLIKNFIHIKKNFLEKPVILLEDINLGLS